jgi:putative transposase
VLWSFAYLGFCRLLELLVLLCRSAPNKELEILVLRQELAICRRQARRPQLTVETVWLTRIYVLFFVSLERRRIEFVACTAHPDGRWIAQQARNLLMTLTDRGESFRFLIHDRDSKFTGAFDAVFQSEDIKIIRTPIRAPNANAYAERWVRTLRSECVDRLLIVSRRQLEHVLQAYRRHYNGHRPHRSLALQPPEQETPTATATTTSAVQVHRRDLLGGLIHEYKLAA